MPVSRALQIEPRLGAALSGLRPTPSSADGLPRAVAESYNIGQFANLYPSAPAGAPLVLIELPASAASEMATLLESEIDLVVEIHHVDEPEEEGYPDSVDSVTFLSMSNEERSLWIAARFLPLERFVDHGQATLLIRTGELLWSRTFTENSFASIEDFVDAWCFVASHPTSHKFQKLPHCCPNPWIVDKGPRDVVVA